MPKRKKRGKSNTRRNKLSHFEREKRYGQITYQKATQRWKDICNQIHMPKLREDVILTSNSFEKVIDVKDFIISLYMDEIYSQEEAHMVAIRHNYDNVERMMEIYFSTVYGIHEDNNRELKRMIGNSLNFLNYWLQEEENSETYINQMCFGMERKRKLFEKQLKSDQFGEINEITTKHHHDISKITSAMEDKFEKIWMQIKKIQSEYTKYLKENKAKYDAIKSLDDLNTSTVLKELNKLIGLQELSKHLTVKSNELDSTLGQKLRLLKSERDSLKGYFITFKNKLQQDRKRDDASRTLITVEFAKAFDYLNEKMNEGEKILKMMSCCRRYESIDDKVQPFPFEGQLEESKLSEDPFLLFWHKIAVIQTSRCALNEERNYLKIQNKKLKEQIHNRCQCLYCPILPPIPKRAGRIPHTDGKDMIRKNKTKNRPK